MAATAPRVSTSCRTRSSRGAPLSLARRSGTRARKPCGASLSRRSARASRWLSARISRRAAAASEVLTWTRRARAGRKTSRSGCWDTVAGRGSVRVHQGASLWAASLAAAALACPGGGGSRWWWRPHGDRLRSRTSARVSRNSAPWRIGVEFPRRFQGRRCRPGPGPGPGHEYLVVRFVAQDPLVFPRTWTPARPRVAEAGLPFLHAAAGPGGPGLGQPAGSSLPGPGRLAGCAPGGRVHLGVAPPRSPADRPGAPGRAPMAGHVLEAGPRWCRRLPQVGVSVDQRRDPGDLPGQEGRGPTLPRTVQAIDEVLSWASRWASSPGRGTGSPSTGDLVSSGCCRPSGRGP